MRTLVIALATLLLAGCSDAHKGGPFAGLNEYDAGQAAADILDQETSSPSSELYNKELAIAGMSKGALPANHRPAWVASLENFDNVRSPWCLYLWGKFTPFQGSDVKYDVESCPDSSGA